METVIPVTDNKKVSYLTHKLDRIHDKLARFQSHKEFHERCLKDQVIPNALKVNLEPSIGNHDEEYLKIWYQEIEELSRKLAKHTINYCDKTIVQASNDIKTVEEELLNVNATNIQVTEIKKDYHY